MYKAYSWTVREEIMCLLIYKELDEKDFPRGLRTKLCREMFLKDNTPPYNSIMLKIGNYETLFTEGKQGMYGGAENPFTKLVYKIFKDCSIKDLKYLLERTR